MKIEIKSTPKPTRWNKNRIEYVIVGGVLTVFDGTVSPNRAGKVLRGPAYSSK